MTVKIYSTPSCPFCKRAKAYLKEHKVKFQDIDVASDKNAAQEMMKKSGQTGVPVLDIDGQIIIGFDEAKIKKALKIK